MTASAAAPQGRFARFLLQLSRDKADTLLMLGAVLLVLAPQAPYLPLWVTLTGTLMIAWRAVVTLRGLRMPPTWILVPLALATMAGVFLTYRSLLGRDSGVAMAVLLVTFKMLEMHARRDLFVVIYLSFFLLLTNFLHSQSIGMAVMMVLGIIGLLTTQLTFQFTGAVPPLKTRLLMAARIVAIAAPFAVALFFLFPRIQGPLWGMPANNSSGRTGLSNTMAPGNISSLAQSEEIAFRAKFAGPLPSQPQRYWRAIVMGDFDGRTWRATPAALRYQELIRVSGRQLDYQVTLEPHGERWMVALDAPTRVPQLVNNVAHLNSQFELRSISPIIDRTRYSAGSHLSYQMEGDAELAGRETWVALPQGFNPRAMQAGLDLQRLPDPAERARAVLAQFNQGGFSYTLEPPLLGIHSVDDFLYRSKAGFCEHFASAFVFLMRSADVPARIVTGYQGGEINPLDNFMEVRQSDAHAWAEIWIAGRGWVRIDPTAAVAPERIERSLARALPQEAGALGGLIELADARTSLLAQWRFRLNAINNSWNQSVLNYDAGRRRELLASLARALSSPQTLGALAAILLVVLAAHTVRARGRMDPFDALYSALSQQLGRLNLGRERHEGPNAYAARLAGSALAPERKAAAVHFLQLYSAYKYGPAAADPQLLKTMKRLLDSTQ